MMMRRLENAPHQCWQRYLVASLICFLLAACHDSGNDAMMPPETPTRQFVPEGLTGRAVSGLFQVGDQLLAATDAGLYAKRIGQENWQLAALGEQQIIDLAIVDDLHWLAAVSDAGLDPSVNPRLLETVNRGSNWQVVDNDFGGAGESSQPIYALYYDERAETLYATGTASLAASLDLGRSWTLVDGAWDGIATGQDALNLHPQRDQIWYGGQNALEQMTLRRVDLVSGDATSFGQLLPSPSVIKDIVFHPEDGDRVYASGEGGILRTIDNGASWTRPLGDVEFRFYFEVVLDPQAPETVFTAGWDKGAAGRSQPLILEVSKDGGENFERFEHDAALLRGGALSMLAVVDDGETVLYIGLDGGGIMKVIRPAMSPASD